MILSRRRKPFDETLPDGRSVYEAIRTLPAEPTIPLGGDSIGLRNRIRSVDDFPVEGSSPDRMSVLADPLDDRRKRLYEQMQGSINPAPQVNTPAPNIPEIPQMQPIKWMDMNPPQQAEQQGGGIGNAIGQLGAAFLGRKKGGSIISPSMHEMGHIQ